MTDMGDIGEVSDAAFVDPFEEDWDDDEMNARHAEYQRLLDDAAVDHDDGITRLGDMDDNQLKYINSFGYAPLEGQ
jgi:hypothetical protein